MFIVLVKHASMFDKQNSKCLSSTACAFGPGGHSIVKNTGGGAGSIVWGLGFWLGKDILGFFKNIDLDNS